MKKIDFYLKITSIFTIFVFIYIALYLLPIKIFDHDEFEHSHVSWCVKEGQVPYKDFVYNRGPILPALNSLVWKTFKLKDEMSTLISLRYVSFLGMLLLLYLTYRLGKTAVDKDIGLYAPMFLISNSVFLLKAIEIRTDVFQNIFWLTGLWLLLTNTYRSKAKPLIVGLLWGVTLLLNLKTSVQISTALIVYWFFNKKSLNIKKLTLILIGLAIVMALWVIELAASKALMPYIQYLLTISGTVSKRMFMQPAVLIFAQESVVNFIKQNILFVIFFFLGAYKIFTSKKDQKPAKSITIIAGVLFVFLFITGFFLQWWLTFLPLFAIIAAYGLGTTIILFKNLKKAGLAAIVLLALILNFYTNGLCLLQGETNAKQIKIANKLLKITLSSDVFFYFWDKPVGAAVFRPHLMYYWEIPLIGAVNQFHKTMDQNIFGDYFISKLKTRSCKVLNITNAELDATFPERTIRFIKENYVYIYDGLWLIKGLDQKYYQLPD